MAAYLRELLEAGKLGSLHLDKHAMLKRISFNFGLPAALLSCCMVAVTCLPNPASAADGVRVVPNHQVTDWWITENKVAPRYPQRAMDSSTQGCVAIGFIIEADGTTSGHRAIAAYPSPVFNRSGMDALKKFRYTPSEKNPGRQPVFATNTFTYTFDSLYDARNGSGENKHETLEAICSAAADEAVNAMMAESAAQAGNGPVVASFGELGDWWVQTERVSPRYPLAQARKAMEGCAAIGFVIEADGTTGSHRAILSQPPEAFSEAALEAIEQWRFSASDSNPGHRPVSTNVVVSFEINPGGKRSADERAADLAICDTAVAEDLAGLHSPAAGN